MRDIAIVIVGVVLLGCICIYFWYIFDGILNQQKNRVLYVSSPVRRLLPILREIISKYIPDTSKVSLIEPGAGLAHMTRALTREFQWKDATAFDISCYSYFFSHFYRLLQPKGYVIKKENVLTAQYPKDACLYCYISTELITGLYESGKLDGTLVISLTFAIKKVEPTEIIPIKGYQKQVLIYDFRNKK